MSPELAALDRMTDAELYAEHEAAWRRGDWDQVELIDLARSSRWYAEQAFRSVRAQA